MTQIETPLVANFYIVIRFLVSCPWWRAVYLFCQVFVTAAPSGDEYLSKWANKNGLGHTPNRSKIDNRIHHLSVSAILVFLIGKRVQPNLLQACVFGVSIGNNQIYGLCTAPFWHLPSSQDESNIVSTIWSIFGFLTSTTWGDSRLTSYYMIWWQYFSNYNGIRSFLFWF